MAKIHTVRTTCRLCESKNIEEFLSLGKTPPANSFLSSKDFNKEKAYPLRAVFCRDCHLAQLKDVIHPKHLFCHYVYFYSAMPKASGHFAAYAKEIKKRFIRDAKKNLIVEIGSNDGLLLKAFQEQGCKNVLGVDPAKNVAKAANKRGVPTIADFFSSSMARKIRKKSGPAGVMIGNNVVAHIDNLRGLAKGIRHLIADKGIFVFQAPYVVDMFENLAYDSIYHEHVSFLSLAPLVYLFDQVHMDIFDVEEHAIQGNSIRVFIAPRGTRTIQPSVHRLLVKEKKLGLHTITAYKKLARCIHASRDKLTKLLKDIKSRHNSIAAYGAPARGMTILNFCNIGKNILEYATEELPTKIGLHTPGTHVPVIHVADARKSPPDYFLLLAWPYKDAIMKKESDFLKGGGKFIMPLGDVKII